MDGYISFPRPKKIKAFPGELMLKDFLTEEMYNRYKDKTTKLGVTLDKCIKGGVDTAKIGPSWNVGKVGFLIPLQHLEEPRLSCKKRAHFAPDAHLVRCSQSVKQKQSGKRRGG